MRPRCGDVARQGEAVKLAWHLDVGEQQDHFRVPDFQQIERGIAVFGIKDPEACLFEYFRGIHADKEIIVDDKCIWSV